MAQLNFVTLMNTLWAWRFSQLSICLIVHLCKWHLLALIQIYPKFIALAIWKTRALLKSKHTVSTDFPLHRTIGLIAKGNLVSQTWLILTDSMIAIYNNLVLHIAKNGFKGDLLHTLQELTRIFPVLFGNVCNNCFLSVFGIFSWLPGLLKDDREHPYDDIVHFTQVHATSSACSGNVSVMLLGRLSLFPLSISFYFASKLSEEFPISNTKASYRERWS